MGACWRHVRHVPQGSSWHTADDLMRGTSVYGVEGVETQAWSIKFDDFGYDQVISMTMIRLISLAMIR